MIKKESAIPIYFQLEESIRSMIQDGTLKPGDPLPSEREYSEQLGISRMTVRQAISGLVSEGLLIRQQGKGTFVSQKKIEIPLIKLTSFSEDMKLRGMIPDTQIIDFQILKPSKKIIHSLSLEPLQKIYQISRLRLADGIPMAYETSHIPVHLISGLTRETLHKQSLYALIEQERHLQIDWAFQTIEPGISSLQESRYLKIKTGSPVLLFYRTSFLQHGLPFEFVKSVYRGDRYKLVTNMKR